MISEEEREELKKEIREEFAKTYGLAYQEIMHLQRFRRRIEADGAELPKRKNVFLGTTMKLLGGGSIQDEDGSYWDRSGIHLRSNGFAGDVLQFETANGTSMGFLTAEVGAVWLAENDGDFGYAIVLAANEAKIGPWSPGFTTFGPPGIILSNIDGSAVIQNDRALYNHGAASAVMPINVSGVFGRASTGASVVNTTAETTIGSFSVPAGAMGSDRAVRMFLAGTYLNNSGGSVTFTLRVKFGGTTWIDVASPSIATSTISRAWWIEVIIFNLGNASANKILMRTLGSSATTLTAGVGGLASPAWEGAAHADSSVNTGSTQTLAVTFQHSTAHANLALFRQHAFIELL